MALYWRYRKSSGEIKGVSKEENIYVDDSYFGVLTDPSTPDGTSFDPQKIWDGSVVRNATAEEIIDLATYEAEDDNLEQRTSAKDFLSDHPTTRKTFKSLVKVLIDEINILRAQHSLADRTLAHAINAIESEIDGGDQD